MVPLLLCKLLADEQSYGRPQRVTCDANLVVSATMLFLEHRDDLFDELTRGFEPPAAVESVVSDFDVIHQVSEAAQLRTPQGDHQAIRQTVLATTTEVRRRRCVVGTTAAGPEVMFQPNFLLIFQRNAFHARPEFCVRLRQPVLLVIILQNSEREVLSTSVSRVDSIDQMGQKLLLIRGAQILSHCADVVITLGSNNIPTTHSIPKCVCKLMITHIVVGPR